MFKTKMGKWYTKYSKRNKMLELKKIKDYDDYLVVSNNNIEIYEGTFENAMKYFGINKVNNDLNKVKTSALNIIMYYQLDEKTMTRTTPELARMLNDAFSSQRYYVNEYIRDNIIFECLREAYDKKLIYDDQIIEDLEKSEKYSAKKRLYILKEFYRRYGDIYHPYY